MAVDLSQDIPDLMARAERSRSAARKIFQVAREAADRRLSEAKE